MLLKMRVTDTAALLKLTERIRKIPGIEQTHTTIVLESQFERSMPIPETDSLSRLRG
jgi:Lrp/AsnC ligand binding domain